MSGPIATVGVQALLAESVAVADGRLFVQGAGWTDVQVPALPASPGRLGIGLLLSVPHARAGERIALAVRVEGPRGDPVPLADLASDALVAELEGSLVAEPVPEQPKLDHQVVPLGFNLDGVRLESEGVHALVIEIDGEPAARVPFVVSVDTSGS
jgi:hypothetical protein